jgi:hypothetical protein
MSHSDRESEKVIILQLSFRLYIQVYAQHVLAVHDGYLYELVFIQWRGQWLVCCGGISLLSA